MTLIKSLILLFLILFSGFVKADQYFITYDQAWANCQSQINQYNTISPNTYNMTCTNRTQYPDVLFQQWYKSNGAFVQFLVSRYTNNTCVLPQVQNTTTGACQTPPACTSPAVYDNPSNSCITPSCLSGQSRSVLAPFDCIGNPTCPAVLPLCSTPGYTCNNGDGTQQNVPKCSNVCDPGFHQVGSMCLADKTTPINCPQDFVAKDGGCVAADPIACGPGTRPGKVDGVTVCASDGSAPGTPVKQKHTGTSDGTESSQTTQKDANGNITGTSTTTTTTHNNLTMDTTGMATESTQKGILDALTANSGKTAWVNSAGGTAPTYADVDAQIFTAKQTLSTSLGNLKSSLGAVFSQLSNGAAISCDGGVNLSTGLHVSICFQNYAPQIAMIGDVLYFSAAVISLLMVLL